MHLEQGDCAFDPAQTLMWKDYRPTPANDVSVIAEADKEIEQADKEVLQERFKNDVLKLQRDIAQIARIAEKEQANARSQRMRKITHLREQNAIGAVEVQKFMKRQCPHVHADSPTLTEEISKAGHWSE